MLRPYWHVDVKWILGIMLVFVVGAALLINSLVVLTQESTAINMMSTIMAGMFSPEGLDAEGDINEVKAKVLSSPERKFQPFPGLDVFITENDLDTLTPRELRIHIFHQIAEPLYQYGLEEGIARLAVSASPEEQQTLANDMGFFAFVNMHSHQVIRKVLLGVLLMTAILLVPFIYVSFGFGRIGNLGCIAFLSSSPGSLILAIANKEVARRGFELPMESGTHVLSNLLPNVVAPMLRLVSRGYYFTACSGLILLAIALVAKLIWPHDAIRTGWLSVFRVPGSQQTTG